VGRIVEKRLLMPLVSNGGADLADASTVPHASRVTISDKFRLINVIFSDELSDAALSSEDSSTRADLDAGLIGYKSPFWKAVEQRFNHGFPPDGVDGTAFADLIHYIHPLFHSSGVEINPEKHGNFPAEKLYAFWKELTKEYDTVFVNFTKSGNHQSSFTRAAMMSLKSSTSTIESDDLHSDDEDEEADEFGMEDGGFCCFTNSLPIVYLRLWLNVKDVMTDFVTREIPSDVQLDSGDRSRKKRLAADSAMIEPGVAKKKKKNTPTEDLAASFASYVKVKQDEASNFNVQQLIGEDFKDIMKSHSLKEKIDVYEKKIAALHKLMENCYDAEKRNALQASLDKMEAEFVKLLVD
jgi:hypothetical protein